MTAEFRAPLTTLTTEEIVSDMKERINRGELSPGDKLPTTRHLCDLYQVSPNTLSGCIRRLKEAGYLSSRVGAGVYVIDPGGKAESRKKRGQYQTISFIVRIHHEDRYAGSYLGHVYDNAVLGIQDESSELGVTNGTVLCPESILRDRDRLPGFIAQHSATADGVYFVGVIPENMKDALATYARKPCIFIVTSTGDSHRHNVFSIDLYRSALAILRHLFDRGYRKVACLGGRRLGQGRQDGGYRHREHAWLDLADEHGLEPSPSLLFPASESEKHVREVAARIVDMPDSSRPDAVFCFNDMRASILLETALAAGLKVPEDLAIAGFDGSRLALDAGITTLELPLYVNGRNAATSMHLLLEGQLASPIFASYSAGVRVGKTT